jgi:hypothetical protein
MCFALRAMHVRSNAALQLRLGLLSFSAIFIGMLVFWFVEPGSCSHYSFQLFGLVPLEVRNMREGMQMQGLDGHCTFVHSVSLLGEQSSTGPPLLTACV